MLIFNKVLPLFVLPLGVSLMLLAWGTFRRRRGVAIAGLLVLLAGSNPVVGRVLIRWTEEWAERRVATQVPTADAIVVLSAGRSVPPGTAPVTEWGDANRFYGGLELYRAQRAPLLVFTGARFSSRPDVPSEGEVLAGLARDNGVDASHILVTGAVENTADEAREIAALMTSRGHTRARIVLVTSAFHMPRARQQFEQAGIFVEPFPVNFLIPSQGGVTLLDVLPSVAALRRTEIALRELYGRAFYRLRSVF